MKLGRAKEDYLEAMLILRNKLGYIRSVDIANKLAVSKPSVSYMTKQLRQQELIRMEDSGMITLTPEGEQIAQMIYERHVKFTKFFLSLGVDEETAYRDACLIEHDLSQQTYQALCRYIDDHRLGQEDPAAL